MKRSNTNIEIDTKTIINNINEIIKKRPDYDNYIAVVKGNCYGHGMELAKYIIKTKINYLAVATLDEAIVLRKHIPNDFPILCLQPIDIYYIDEIIKNNITITISSYQYYQNLIKKAPDKNIKIHIKLNTGMNRLGLETKEEVKKIYDDLIVNKKYNLTFEGIYSHFSTLGIVDKKWDMQVEEFKNLTSLIDLKKIKMVHMSSSYSLSVHPKLDFCNTVRIGQLIYGNNVNNINKEGFINKLKEIKRNYVRKKQNLSKLNEDFFIDVKPAFKLVSTIEEIKYVKKNSSVGYDGEYTTKNDEYIAMIPIGYTDGLNKNFQNKYVIINNRKYQIVGEINMCMTLIRVDNAVKVGDKVTLIGDDLSPKQVARSLNISVPYLFCTLKDYIKKIYK